MQQNTFIVDESLANLNLTVEENINLERNFIVSYMRFWADNFDIKSREIYIPDECEKYGFVEGKYKIGELIRFLADMVEE